MNHQFLAKLPAQRRHCMSAMENGEFKLCQFKLDLLNKATTGLALGSGIFIGVNRPLGEGDENKGRGGTLCCDIDRVP